MAVKSMDFWQFDVRALASLFKMSPLDTVPVSSQLEIFAARRPWPRTFCKPTSLIHGDDLCGDRDLLVQRQLLSKFFIVENILFNITINKNR